MTAGEDSVFMTAPVEPSDDLRELRAGFEYRLDLAGDGDESSWSPPLSPTSSSQIEMPFTLAQRLSSKSDFEAEANTPDQTPTQRFSQPMLIPTQISGGEVTPTRSQPLNPTQISAGYFSNPLMATQTPNPPSS
ncbi:hypothetical protein H0H93_003350, partial [Arthromyces matolae]